MVPVICNIVAAYLTVEEAGDWFVGRINRHPAPNPIDDQEPDYASLGASEGEDKQWVKEASRDGYRIAISVGMILKHYAIGCDGVLPWMHNGEEVDHYKVLCVDKRIYHSMKPSFRGVFGTKKEVDDVFLALADE